MRRSSFAILAIVFQSLPSAAQQLRFGFIGGTNLTHDFHTTNDTYILSGSMNPYQLNVLRYSPDRSDILGPMLELSLPRNFSIEVNALHRTLRVTQVVTSLFAGGTRESSTDQFVGANTWEFPVLLKYALPVSRLRPFVEFGPSFRIWDQPLAVEPSNYGITAGLGAEITWGKLKFAPVVRYTRWASERRFPLYPTNPDQVELLGSVSYATSAGSRRVAGRRIWLGLLGGPVLTEGFHLGTFASPQQESFAFAVGLSVEVALNRRLSVEVDGIYRPLHAETMDTLVDGTFFRNPFSVLTWQIPLLAKHRFTDSRYAPFVEGGPSLRLSGNKNGYEPSWYGATVGAGIEARVGGARLSPLLRYTRWAKDRNPFSGSRVDYSRTTANQLEILLSFSF